MKKLIQQSPTQLSLIVLVSVAFLAFLFLSCESNPSTPNLYYDTDLTTGPAPTITSISPTTGLLAGVTTITITGTNFSTVKEQNLVYFDSKLATVTQASATQLVMTAPNYPKDTIIVKVAVYKVDKYSNSLTVKIGAAVAVFGDLGVFDEPYGIACDSAGNLYVSMTTSSLGAGIKKFTPAGVRSDYAPSGGVAKFSGLKFGPSGYLYGVRGLAAVYRVAPGGGTPTLWMLPSSGIGAIYDFDFDAQGNLWGGGSGTDITRIKQDKSVKLFPFLADVQSIRVYNGYLYVTAKTDSSNIWRFQIINSDSLGQAEKYFSFSSQYGVAGAAAYAITFSTDGYMYVGTDGVDGVIIVAPNKTWQPLYPGLFQPQSLVFAWGKADELYVSRSGTVASHSILKVLTLKNGAPYYGRQ
jgi:hypothetical protein